MSDRNYSTKRVNMEKGGYALFVGGESVIIGDIVFNGCGDQDSGSIQWVMNAIGEMVSGSPS